MLNKGEYIISVCTCKEGDVGSFMLQIFLEDEFNNDIKEIKNSIQLKNSYFERLNSKDIIKGNFIKFK